ncbi:hypothetical protein Tco_0392276 [Tanacetum coccineum]
MLASGISALRLVDGVGSGIVRGGRISEGKKDGGGGGEEAITVMYASIGTYSRERGACSSNYLAASS